MAFKGEDRLAEALDRLIEVLSGSPRREGVVTGGRTVPAQYVRVVKKPVTAAYTEVFDRSPEARYRLVQVSGSDAVRLYFTDGKPEDGIGLVLLAGQSYEMARIYGNLVLGKIWAQRVSQDSEITLVEIGES
jgi:hypothetical protein